MNTLELRKIIRANRDQIKSLSLTKNDVKYLDFIESNSGATCGDLSKNFDLSVEPMHAKLKKLRDKGYIYRNRIPLDNNKIRYKYFISKN